MKFKLMLSVLLLSISALAFGAAKEVNIAYVKAPFNLQNIVIKNNKLLENEFAKDGIKVNWYDITSGSKQTQGMAAGSLDMSAVMNTASILMANAAGNPIVIATGVAHPTEVFAIVGKPGENYKIEDRKGKTVVGPKGTVLHQTLVAALVSKGIKPEEVEFINMDIPKGLAALLAGKVDAALLAAGAVIKANENGAKTITTAKGLVEPNLVMTARKQFADENPELVERIVKVNREALQWIKDHPDEALEIGAKEHGITKEEAKMLADWSNFYDVLTEEDIKDLEKDQQFLKENGMLENPVDVTTLVLPGAMK
ncbi:MAG: ABC transporter substrate-binding protein [Burkholderiales bacterium]|nr:ABC transporter substrate-binding protein [Burkholderiales bacterium]